MSDADTGKQAPAPVEPGTYFATHCGYRVVVKVEPAGKESGVLIGYMCGRACGYLLEAFTDWRGPITEPPVPPPAKDALAEIKRWYAALEAARTGRNEDYPQYVHCCDMLILAVGKLLEAREGK